MKPSMWRKDIKLIYENCYVSIKGALERAKIMKYKVSAEAHEDKC